MKNILSLVGMLALGACAHTPSSLDIQSIRSGMVNLPIPGEANTYLSGYVFHGKTETVPTGDIRLAVIGRGDVACDAYASKHNTLVVEDAFSFSCWAPTTGPSTEVVHFGEIEREEAETGFSVGS